MEIIVAKSAGFCFGVNMAVNKTDKLTESTDKPIYTLGPIIHNENVVEKLKQKGVNVVEHVDEISGTASVVIRAHGVTPDVYSKIKERELELTDATCPYVKKIHKLVEEKYKEGCQIIIVGDKKHPEVIGINGWCNNEAIIVNNVEEVESIIIPKDKICVVAQTTITAEKWKKINDLLQKKFENIEKFDTICSATSKRQNEAEEIAKNVDIMFVVGGKNSSNTEKLYEICKKYCQETYKVETAGEIPLVDIKKINKIGITAGASTPDWVIEEVITRMSEFNKQNDEMDFLTAFESSLVELHTGDIVKGKVIGNNNNEVFVDLGYKCDGVISKSEFSDEPDLNLSEAVKAGDEIEVFVIRVNDGEGNVLLSKKKVDAMKMWSKIEEAHKAGTILNGRVVEIVKGGAIASVNGVRVFIPASQISDRFVSDLKEFYKQPVSLKILEFDPSKRKIVGSQRVVLESQKAASATKLWESIEVGKQYTGTVKSLMDFGAFVDIGGLDGLIHISELSWNKIKHPKEVLSVGDKVNVVVLEFDKEKKKIALGYRKTEDNPWSKAAQKYNIGDVLKVNVVRFAKFGAFVELEPGVDGLVHISQISNKRIVKPEDVLTLGQVVEAKITELNLEQKKISLSIKEVSPIDLPGAEGETAEELPTEHKEELNATLADAVKKDK